MANIRERLRSFFEGNIYPVFIALTVFISHTLSIEAFSIIVLSACTALCAVLCNDLRYTIAPVFMITFTFSYKTFLSGWLGGITFAILAIGALVLIIGAFIAHIFLYKKHLQIKELPSSKLFWGIVAVSGALLLNGLFSFENYQPINITFALILVFALAFCYFTFFLGINAKKDILEYVIYILYVASVLLVLEMIILLLRDATLNENGSIIKESLILGWGVWNNVGGMLTMLLPVHFYYAATKKHGYIFYISAVIVYLTIALTLSRSSLLFATIVFAICVVIICSKGCNTRTNRIITACVAAIGVLGVIALFDKIYAVLGSYISQGLGDNGRLALYKHGIENFLSNPIFGGGLGSCPEDNFGHGIDPNRYHNTVIELLATCGIVGFGAYAFHRYQTIRLVWKKRSDLSVIFLSIVILGLLLTSLLDNHIFNIYPTMYYSIVLCVLTKYIEKESE